MEMVEHVCRRLREPCSDKGSERGDTKGDAKAVIKGKLSVTMLHATEIEVAIAASGVGLDG